MRLLLFLPFLVLVVGCSDSSGKTRYASSSDSEAKEKLLGTLAIVANNLSAFRILAEQGEANAQYLLGSVYDHGAGVPEDDKEAVKWYRKAADQGLSSAQFHLAESYRFGEGGEKDESESVRWCRKAAEKGHPDAQVSLGGA